MRRQEFSLRRCQETFLLLLLLKASLFLGCQNCSPQLGDENVASSILWRNDARPAFKEFDTVWFVLLDFCFRVTPERASARGSADLRRATRLRIGLGLSGIHQILKMEFLLQAARR